MAMREPVDTPLAPFLESQGVMILDGGLATELETRGYDLSDDLWSARVLMEEPELVRDVHFDYLRSGADCVVSASYQATFQGFAKRGVTSEKSSRLLEQSVALAKEAREAFWGDPLHRQRRVRPLVAASIGPYGAYLADGSEFRGDYGLGEEDLLGFHRSRWEVLSSAGADLLACETLPSRLEARVLRRLLEASPGLFAWFSFSCRNGTEISDGSSVRDVAAELDDCPQILSLGVNCTPPRYISDLVSEFRHGTSKPIVVYPNSGEAWDGDRRTWIVGETAAPSLVNSCRRWVDRGVQLIGGCCRTGPEDIEEIRRALLSRTPAAGRTL